MTNANANTERATYTAFERFLYYFLIPLIYSSVLVFVLFIIFNEDVRTSFLRTANQIPVIRELVPDVKQEDPRAYEQIMEDPEVKRLQQEAKQQVAVLESELRSAIEASRQKDSEIAALQERIAELETLRTDQEVSSEQYEENLRSLARMYANMRPSKAAPILENLSKGELVQVLSYMTMDQRSALLERMDPETAAEVTSMMIDMESIENAQITALKERIQQLETELAGRADALTTEQLAATFAVMDASSAANVLLEMLKQNEGEVINILRAMELPSRSAILAQISDLDKSAAARLSSKLSG
ncbi:hypothetical protein PRECH8_10250 [Insulibacter thermoxylanivorax]|uniref:Magnesium transporter MgtE intracellular domain-containing protein n=1 Tax=Insulibacter thermoxylanivorax TaxID=2749268 RepID=A0A916VFJ5_9BACL|nr:hypothetical protein [Insulibacter thermoxylanivorax]GFR37729.1 hypothetical protein PRECH8_10250 [Insulibacter thermoxylanivorax]